MARKKNPRRTLITELRWLKAHIGNVISWWDVTGAVIETDSENGRIVGHHRRERRYDEYRENVPQNWDAMARDAQDMAARFVDVAAFCRREARYAREREAARS